MQNVLIIGLGLIGGSTGMALKKWSNEHTGVIHVVGYDQDIDRQQLAKSKGAIDAAKWNLPEAVADADVIIIATPVGAMKQIFEDIGPHLKNGAIITDTGSTKTDVLAWAESLPAHAQFIGGHPMAGGSTSLEDARADLFEAATWMLCPSATASHEAIANIQGLVNAVGAEPFFVEPGEHDAYVGGISHLPFVVASALVRTATSAHSWRDMKSLAATGFRDTTRVALGNPTMHRDIVITNRASLIRWIDAMIGNLQEFRGMLEDDGDDAEERLLDWFKETQDARAAAESVYRRSSEMDTEATNVSMGSTMGRMFLGGFGRKRNTDKRGR